MLLKYLNAASFYIYFFSFSLLSAMFKRGEPSVSADGTQGKKSWLCGSDAKSEGSSFAINENVSEKQREKKEEPASENQEEKVERSEKNNEVKAEPDSEEQVESAFEN